MLADSGILNLSVIVSEESARNGISTVIDVIQQLKVLASTINATAQLGSTKLAADHQWFLSLQVPHSAHSLIEKILEIKDFYWDLIVLHANGEKEAATESVNKLHNMVQASGLPTLLGLGTIQDATQLDWILCKLPQNALGFIHLGTVKLPSLRVHCTEIAHQRGLNTMFDIDATDLEQSIMNSEVLYDLAAKYEIELDTFLVKCLLQLGYVVGIPYSLAIDQEGYIEEHFSRLCHPFVYRKEFVSSIRIISLKISSQDVDVLINASEEFEMLDDHIWQPHATSRADQRILTHSVDMTS